MSMRRLGRDPVMGDVVRRRLEELVAEIAPRHATGGPDAPREGGNEPLPAPEALPVVDAVPGAAPRRAAAQPRAAGGAVTSGVLRRGWEFGRAHAAVVAILGLLGVGWALLGMGTARTTPVVPTPVAVAATTPTATATPAELQVHVVGAVARPGVVRLPVGARVADAIAAAGGVTPEARLGELNLAAVVTDGAQVVVGGGDRVSAVRDGGGGSVPAAGAGQVDLNTATAEQLDGLPGVGPVTARRILEWRAAHQRFNRVEELQEVDGIGAKTFAQLKPHVRV